MNMKKEPLLSVKEIRCGYADVEVVHGLSFDVYENEILCILGPNGCGKTTLLRAINHILPCQGIVTACGRNVNEIKRTEIARIMSLMSQVNSIFFSYSVYETVMLGRYAHQQGFLSGASEQDKKIVEESLRRTGMWQLKDKSISELSGGQVQRVMLARVFAQSPNIILLDEPMNHLDLKYQIELMNYLKEWVQEDNRCIVSVLHDINMALSFADGILLLKDGECAAFSPAETFPIQKLNEVYDMNIGNYMRKSLSRWDFMENQNIEK